MANAPAAGNDYSQGFSIGATWADNELGQLYIATSVALGAAVWERFATFSELSKQSQPGGRLTLTSGIPVTTADVVGATNIYFTPYATNTIALWTGSTWLSITFSEYTLPLGTLTAAKNYDIFAYLTGTALTLEMLAWTNDTTRATGISIQDGRYCKTGNKTRLYLGTFRTTSTTTTEDSFVNGASSGSKRFLWNMYYRHPRPVGVDDTTASWTYSTAAWRQARGDAGNKVEFVVGLSEDPVRCSSFAYAITSATARIVATGIGLDSTTTVATKGGAFTASTGAISSAEGRSAELAIQPSIGYHFLSWNEYGFGTNTQTWSGSTGIFQVGLYGTVFA